MNAAMQESSSLASSSVLDHYVRDLNIFLGLIFRRDLKYDILLMAWNRLLADCFKKLAHAAQELAL